MTLRVTCFFDFSAVVKWNTILESLNTTMPVRRGSFGPRGISGGPLFPDPAMNVPKESG
jgi:hypothetical protein